MAAVQQLPIHNYADAHAGAEGYPHHNPLLYAQARNCAEGKAIGVVIYGDGYVETFLNGFLNVDLVP